MLNSNPNLGNASDLHAVDDQAAHYVPIHPLYGILYSKSLFNKFSGYKIPSFDMSLEDKPLNKTQFYTELLSQSLPAIFKNECKTWRFYTSIKSLGSEKQDAFINDLFKGVMSHIPFVKK